MNKLQANFCLLAVTLCWSCEVVIFSVIPDGVNPFATTCVTSLIGLVLMGACFARRIAAAFRRDRWLLVRRIAVLSIMNTVYNVLNLVGLDYFNVSTGAFTLSMTVVVLPVMLLVMKRGVDVRTWISAGCVLAGIVVAVFPTISLPQVSGLLVMLTSCAIRAIYIVRLNDYAHKHDPITLAAGISGFNAVIAFVPWCVMQPITFAGLPWSSQLVAAYFIYAYFIVGFATILNIFAQRRATAAQSTIIYSTEIVFSTIWATCLPASIVDPVNLTIPIIVGCAFIVAGNLVEIVFPGASERANEGEAASVAQEASIAKEPTGMATVAIMKKACGMLGRPVVRNVGVFVILLGVYIAIALPFKVLTVIPGFTDVRPVSMLQPVYGIFFGIPGCLAFAVGNLIGDIVSDSLRWSSIAGFVGNFAAPYIMYVFWCRLRKKCFDLRSGKALALMAMLVAVDACVQAAIIAPAVAVAYPGVEIAVFIASVLGNGIAFPLAFSIPLIILMQEELGFEPLRRVTT